MASKSKPAKTATTAPASTPAPAPRRQPDRGRGGRYNAPWSPPPPQADATRQALSQALRAAEKGRSKCQTDEEFVERIDAYLMECLDKGERPCVSGVALAVGEYRQRLWDWRTGAKGCSKMRADAIKKVYDIMEMVDEQLMVDGKMSETAFIWLSKNFHGMKDVQEVVITPNSPLGEEMQDEEIIKLYEELPPESVNG